MLEFFKSYMIKDFVLKFNFMCIVKIKLYFFHNIRISTGTVLKQNGCFIQVKVLHALKIEFKSSVSKL